MTVSIRIMAEPIACPGCGREAEQEDPHGYCRECIIESHLDEPEGEPAYCDRCHNTGQIDCYCGGDLCVCGRQDLPCPAPGCEWSSW